MKGLVRRHGATWQYQFSVTRGGKRQHKTRSGFKSEKLAWAAMREAMAPWANSAHVEPSKQSLATFLREQWLPNQGGKKPTTRAGYEHWVERRIIPELGETKLSEITGGEIAALYGRLRNGGRMDGKAGGLSERSIKQLHAVLHRALEYAVKTRAITRNPMDDLDVDVKPSPRRVEMRTWSGDELRVFLASVDGEYPFAGLFTLAATTGMRRSELLALRWADVDFAAGLIAVRRGLTTANYELHTGEPKTGRARVIDMDPDTAAMLKRHRTRELEIRMASMGCWQDHDLVFTDGLGASLHPHSVSQTFDRRVKRAKVARIRFHDLRHTHATLLLQANVPAKVVAERLGHSSISITLDVYTHVAPGMRADAAARVGAIVFGGIAR